MGRVSRVLGHAWGSIRARVVTGLVVIVPVVLTVWVVRIVFQGVDGILRPYITRLIGREIPGVGLVATLLLLYLAGLLVQNVGGKTLLYYAERVLLKLPFLRDIYGASKQIMETFANPKGVGFKRVVSFEYPRPGIRAFGFITNELIRPDGKKEIAVFLPTSPNPTSGYLLFLPEEDVRDTKLTVDQALKMIVSGGVVLPRPYDEILLEPEDPRDELGGEKSGEAD